ILEVMHRVLQRYTLERAPWREFQKAGLMWTPLRKSHENVADAHWEKRRTFAEVAHPELGRSFTYPIAKWVTRWPDGVDWRRGAEDLKVEWIGSMDHRVHVQTAVGGRAAREKATEPLPPDNSTINRSASFNDLHPGQRSVSLNVRHPKGLEIIKRLIAVSDVV